MKTHKHKTQTGIILDADGRDSGERWVSCATCFSYLGTQKALPFIQEPKPAYAHLIRRVA